LLYHALVVQLSSIGPSEPSAQPSPSGRAALPRASTLDGEPNAAPSLPIHIRVAGRAIGQKHRDDIARKLATKLGKFAPAIERITIRLSDVNGPKGGRDQKCQIKVVLGGLSSVVVNEMDVTLLRVADRAIAAAALAVQRTVQRRRLKPLHHRTGGLRRWRSEGASHVEWR
jgi:hypothetical protein